MTTSVKKEEIKQTWDTKKIQEAATKVMALQIATRIKFVETHPGKEIEDMEKTSAMKKAEMMKECGVNSPMDLVRHMAEFEVNTFGATAAIEGDDSNATLFNEKPTVWLQAKAMAKMSKEQEEKMHSHHKQWMKDLAAALKFKVKHEIAPDGNSEKITFSRA